jgi:hypothetical protein
VIGFQNLYVAVNMDWGLQLHSVVTDLHTARDPQPHPANHHSLPQYSETEDTAMHFSPLSQQGLRDQPSHYHTSTNNDLALSDSAFSGNMYDLVGNSSAEVSRGLRDEFTGCDEKNLRQQDLFFGGCAGGSDLMIGKLGHKETRDSEFGGGIPSYQANFGRGGTTHPAFADNDVRFNNYNKAFVDQRLENRPSIGQQAYERSLVARESIGQQADKRRINSGKRTAISPPFLTKKSRYDDQVEYERAVDSHSDSPFAQAAWSTRFSGLSTDPFPVPQHTQGSERPRASFSTPSDLQPFGRALLPEAMKLYPKSLGNTAKSPLLRNRGPGGVRSFLSTSAGLSTEQPTPLLEPTGRYVTSSSAMASELSTQHALNRTDIDGIGRRLEKMSSLADRREVASRYLARDPDPDCQTAKYLSSLLENAQDSSDNQASSESRRTSNISRGHKQFSGTHVPNNVDSSALWSRTGSFSSLEQADFFDPAGLPKTESSLSHGWKRADHSAQPYGDLSPRRPRELVDERSFSQQHPLWQRSELRVPGLASMPLHSDRRNDTNLPLADVQIARHADVVSSTTTGPWSGALQSQHSYVGGAMAVPSNVATPGKQQLQTLYGPQSSFSSDLAATTRRLLQGHSVSSLSSASVASLVQNYKSPEFLHSSHHGRQRKPRTPVGLAQPLRREAQQPPGENNKINVC